MQLFNQQSPYKQGETPYQIFSDRMSAVSSLADGIKQMISNKYINKQNTMIADNIQNQIDEQKSNELVNLISAPPSEDIYPDNLNATVGAFVDKYVMSPMMQKEQAGMGLTPSDTPLNASNLPQVPQQATQQQSTPNAVSGETMLPKNNVQQLYNIIKDLPTGQISWDNIYKEMTAGKKPYFMGQTDSEKFVMGQMINQVKDPRNKLESDVNLAKLVDETFNPKPDKATSDFERYMDNPEEYKAFKEAGRTPKAPTEWDKKIDLIMQLNPTVDEMKKFVGVYIAPENKSAFEERLDIILQTNPSNNELKKFLGTYIAPKSGDEPKTPTWNTDAKIEEGFLTEVENMDDFVGMIKKLKSLNIDTAPYETTEYYAKIMKDKFDEKMEVVRQAAAKIEAGTLKDEDYNYKNDYIEFMNDAKRYAEEYKKVTGETLDIPYMSFEEYETTDTKKDSWKPNTWWRQKPSSLKIGE